ncbi:MbcA/ParS/Xre antitoxin family protein [Muricauda oceani]|uniref:DUF2384 domain-containing protein n=1 Tax=Flagellimonas oceani TaxID=2698672 RepID=A0A6G7IZZ6_9FLAO|nr:MbcA/ParS/Xre antitoxin family protein [Allomuricauda oceani]MBW8244225.1 MbcA/ParS/Xre antitoxin family protein [Allomuricauda oceani]QII44125.1 DUF2384 domain-containing protein [Allomuricauda oceani]
MAKKVSSSRTRSTKKTGKHKEGKHRHKSVESHRGTVRIKTKVSPQQLDLDEAIKLDILHFLPRTSVKSPTYNYSDIKPLLSFLGYNQEDSSKLLEANPSTLSRWKNSDKPVDIGKIRSKVILDIDEVIAKGVRLFGGEESFQDWLNTNNYALGDVKPVDLLKDVYSIELVEEAIDAMSWGSYL